jgi:hypothetical protein
MHVTRWSGADEVARCSQPREQGEGLKESRVGRPGLLAATGVCFVIAALAFTGVILRGDLVGRAIFGTVWTVLGVVWLGWYVGGSRTRGERE